ncbi:hypothetical protein QR680_019332 [Steinernema hermaphroditum]|uniref:Mo25-like protein n=1 Tax=Steinernema hermaphroditum TaxID=289476 RepID=A0AA39GN26_9BILA|nr:hypothetical protein QR680_019332 [Steinernema hermaphroditum]
MVNPLLWKVFPMHLLPHRTHRAPSTITKALREELLLLQTDIKPHDKVLDYIARYLEEAKHLICDHDALYYQAHEHCNPVIELAEEFCYDDLWSLIVAHLSCLSFEAKKDVGLIFVNLLERKIGSRSPTAEYLRERPEILVALMKGYSGNDHETALVCGQMLRECAKFEMLTKAILNSKHFFNFFDYMESEGFEVQTDACKTFKRLLQAHKNVTAQYLMDNYTQFFKAYAQLLQSENYVTRRQLMEFLGELLAESHNQDVTDKYIESADNLKLILHIMQDKSHIIEFEAFNVLKIFVTNPHKTMEVMHLFVEQKKELIHYLHNFLPENDDEAFLDEKHYVIKEIQGLSLDAVVCCNGV